MAMLFLFSVVLTEHQGFRAGAQRLRCVWKPDKHNTGRPHKDLEGVFVLLLSTNLVTKHYDGVSKLVKLF